MNRKIKLIVIVLACILGIIWLGFRAGFNASANQERLVLSAAFEHRVLKTEAEAPLDLRIFTTAVKTDSRGEIITGPTDDPVKNIVGAESAGVRGGMERFTKIMYGAAYIDGRPDPGTRIDPNNPVVHSGNQKWPLVPQPFRSEPRALALTPDGSKLYVTLPGREGYPDWRVAVVDTNSRRVLRWIDLRPPGQTLGLRPIGIKVSPVNTAIRAKPYAVVLNQYSNFASVIDTNTDAVIGDFETGFYGEKLVFNSTGTRLYITDRFKDEVRAFRVEAGPTFTQIAEIPTGTTELERANPRDLDLSADGKTLYVANTMGHNIAVINVENDANTFVKNLPLGGLSTDVKIAGRWGIVSGQETNTKLNEKESGHGLPTKDANGIAIKNNGQPLGYTPVMSDATKATTFDDIGSELNIFDTATNLFIYRYVDEGRDISQLVTPGQYVDLGDHVAAQKIIKGSGPEQMTVRGNLLFVTMMHSEKVQAFRINPTATNPSQILTPLGIELTGGISPQGVEAAPDGRTIYVANFQTEDVSSLSVDTNGNLQRQGFLPVGVTNTTPDPTTGGNGKNLFATDEEAGLRWFFSAAYSDDGQKSCGFCHWDGRQDGCQWNVAANAVGGVKVCPQNKDISDNWPEWYEGLNNDFMAYASACNGEVLLGERGPTPLFPQADLETRLHAREDYVRQKTEADSNAIGRNDLNGKAKKVGYNDMAYLQILWSQNETRRFPNPLDQFPDVTEAAKIARGKDIFTKSVAQGGSGCAECHHNGNKLTNGVLDDTFQDFNIHEPGVISESTVDGNGPFYRPANDYFFTAFAEPQDVGTPQNFSSRNTKHLRTLWDAVPRYLHYGFAHNLREILLAPDSPLLLPGERGFNFRTVRTDQRRGANNLPTEVPVTFAGSNGVLAGDGMGQIMVSLDSPSTLDANGKPLVDRLGTSNVAPLTTGGQINPALAANNIQVIKETHGKTSQLSASDLDALITYLKSASGAKPGATPQPSPSPSPNPSPSPSASPSPSPSASPSPSPSASPSPSPSPSGSKINCRVADKNGNGQAGVMMTLSGYQSGTVQTDDNGNYSFANLPNGNYTLTASKAGFTFNPPTLSFNNLNGDQTATFTATPRLIVSEFRFRGPAGASDEFVELYNPMTTALTVNTSDGSNGWTLAALDGAGTGATTLFVIPNGTLIPAHAHYLVANNAGYSLASCAVADATFNADIPDNSGVALFDTGDARALTKANRLDGVGTIGASGVAADIYRKGSGLPMTGTAINADEQQSFVRKMNNDVVQETGDNAADFDFISTTGGNFGGAVNSILGAPGPDNLASPILRTDLTPSLIDPVTCAACAPNRTRVGSGNSGTISIRRHFTNDTGATVTRLRFRVFDITTLNTPVALGPQADLRLADSQDVRVTTNFGQSITVKGTTLEQPSTATPGGGLNTAMQVVLPAGGLASGQGVDVQFVLNVVSNGRFRFFINVEALQ